MFFGCDLWIFVHSSASVTGIQVRLVAIVMIINGKVFTFTVRFRLHLAVHWIKKL